jgi:anti-sigma regulatory factor (Ser/Thr protein kinase)
MARPMPEGARLLLYTDGLVECRDTPLHDRLGRLRAVLADLCAPETAVDVREGCERVAREMLTGAEHDDVAVLFVAARPAETQKAEVALSPTLEAARAARRFAMSTVDQWGLEKLGDSIISIVSELVTNAVEHAAPPIELRLRRRPGAVMVEVADGDGRLARPTPTGAGDERHRGLVIVATLAARWGVRPTVTGKVVWAEVANPYDDASTMPLAGDEIDSLPGGTLVDDALLDDTAFNDTGFDDTGFDNTALDGAVFDDAGLDDSAVDDTALDNTVFDDTTPDGGASDDQNPPPAAPPNVDAQQQAPRIRAASAAARPSPNARLKVSKAS